MTDETPGTTWMSRDALSSRADADLRAKLLYDLLVSEGADSAHQLPEGQAAAWESLLRPKARGSAALLTVRVLDPGGTPAVLARAAALLFDELLVEPGSLISTDGTARADLSADVLQPLEDLGCNWVHPVAFPTYGMAPLPLHAAHKFLGAPPPGTPYSLDEMAALPGVETVGSDLRVYPELELTRLWAAQLQIAQWLGVTLVSADRFKVALGDAGLLNGPTLDIELPSLDSLTWTEITEIRSHGGSNEARNRLFGWEREASTNPTNVSAAHDARVGNAISADLLSATNEISQDLGGTRAREVAFTAASPTPGEGRPDVARVLFVVDANGEA